ncbi:type IIS restriction endonuclease, putative [Carnobacterium sp. AT7]|uniref:Eco57I restriction-modification methylase domain-containing protein n=1 Tax=Carnobacterium sp. AT7 TaxID=333990 RepID=UPI00015F1CB2|nr:N-6 DNA methylase [Carnobacterium sp. AT7]EDP69027.1 type IIS restriction endonuclease, putative [Carnobacterium sp. AT7]
MLTTKRLSTIDDLVKKLSNENDKWMSLAIAIDLADEVLKVILPENDNWENQLSRNSRHTGTLPAPLTLDTFKNQKQISWFNIHPESTSARSAFKLFYSDDCALESNFFWFSESATKQKIAAATEYSQNWEDSELTRKPEYKVGIDFFLTPDTSSLMVVISNHQKLRVLELHGHLSNTQKLIFKDKLNGAAAYTGIEKGEQLEFEPQRTIHTTLWNALQLKEVNKQFYGYVASHYAEVVTCLEKNGKNSEDSKQFSSRLLGRLLFIWFLRKMDVINESIGYFETNDLTATEYYNQRLKLLFFETLNTEIGSRTSGDLLTPYLNGGLFEAKENDFIDEIIKFPKDFFTRLYNHFDEFNFTTDESSADFELIAVDPEMLGQVFESLLASQTNNEDNNERNNTGSFYTPREIVAYMVKETLRQYLYSRLDEASHKGIDELLDLSDSQWLNRKSTSSADVWGVNSKKVISEIKIALDNFKAIDPAAGSGAFPMGMLQQLLKTYERIEKRFDSYKLKLSIIENNIFGVDIQPMAIEISRLRAWLSVIVDEKDISNIKPLPNLDFKFIAANSLIKLEDGQTDLFADTELDVKLHELRNKYFNAKSPNKKKEYQEKYYKLTLGQGNVFDDERTMQLKSFDPFKNRTAAKFFDPHVMFGITEGFDAVIGNPPYLLEGKSSKDKFVGIPYYQGKMDLWYSFACLGIDMLNKNGHLAYIAKNNWVTNSGASKLRNKVIKETQIIQLIDFGELMVFESADQQTMIMLFSKNNDADNYQFDYSKVTAHKDQLELLDVSKVLEKSSPEVEYLNPKINRMEFIDCYLTFSASEDLLNKINSLPSFYLTKEEVSQGIVFPQDFLNKANQKKLGDDFTIGHGIFAFTSEEKDQLHLTENEESLIKPYYMPEQLKPYYTDPRNKNWLIYTGKEYKFNDSLDNFPHLKEHLEPFLSILTSSNKPYGLHRMRVQDLFEGEKVVAVRKSVGRPIFSYSDFDCYVSQSCNIIKPKKISTKVLTGIINSKLIAFWLKEKGKMQGNNYQLDKEPLLKIPLRVPQSNEIENLVNKILEKKNNQESTFYLEKELGKEIYLLYGLNNEEVERIETSIPDWSSLI